MEKLQFNQTTLSLAKGDITRCEVDAVVEQATAIAVGTIQKYLENHPGSDITEITFVCFDDATVRAYEQAFEELERGTD